MRHELRSQNLFWATKQSIRKTELGYQIFFQEKPLLWIASQNKNFARNDWESRIMHRSLRRI
jgi:hypothetical protein